MRPLPVLLGLLALSGSRTVWAESCARAKLSGDPGAIARVTDELRRLGVTTGEAARCRTIDATVAIEGTGIAVAIAAPGRGSEGRVVGDARVAAVWIDSWLRDDFEGLEPEPLPPPVAVHARVAPAPLPPSIFDRATIAASYERDYVDGATWSGITATACVHVGALCLGGRVRGATASATPLAGMTGVTVARSDLAALAVASTGIGVGRTIISPELGVGIGRFATTRATRCVMPTDPPMGCDPGDPSCPPPPTDGMGCLGADGSAGATTTTDTATTYGPRGEAALRIAIPLFEHVWLDAAAGISVAPWHRGQPPEGTTMTDPTTGTMAMPGEPLATFQLGVGIRIGAPGRLP